MRFLLIALFAPLAALYGEPVCKVDSPTASLAVPWVQTAPELNTDPQSRTWAHAGSGHIVRDCTHTLGYPKLDSEVRAFWTANDLYLLFICPYDTLNLFLPAKGGGPRDKLWDRDVVEMFLGDDWRNIGHYREFEIAPTGDWIDLAIDLDKQKYDQNWRSGWQTQARIDEKSRIWYAAARIPLKSISTQPLKPGARWRANLYRIEGQGPDERRHFMCWQPTCVINRDPNHVPENFGTLIFTR